MEESCGKIGEPMAGTLMHGGQSVMSSPPSSTLPLSAATKPYDHIEAGGLAGTVGA